MAYLGNKMWKIGLIGESSSLLFLLQFLYLYICHLFDELRLL